MIEEGTWLMIEEGMWLMIEEGMWLMMRGYVINDGLQGYGWWIGNWKRNHQQNWGGDVIDDKLQRILLMRWNYMDGNMEGGEDVQLIVWNGSGRRCDWLQEGIGDEMTRTVQRESWRGCDRLCGRKYWRNVINRIEWRNRKRSIKGDHVTSRAKGSNQKECNQSHGGNRE